MWTFLFSAGRKEPIMPHSNEAAQSFSSIRDSFNLKWGKVKVQSEVRVSCSDPYVLPHLPVIQKAHKIRCQKKREQAAIRHGFLCKYMLYYITQCVVFHLQQILFLKALKPTINKILWLYFWSIEMNHIDY